MISIQLAKTQKWDNGQAWVGTWLETHISVLFLFYVYFGLIHSPSQGGPTEEKVGARWGGVGCSLDLPLLNHGCSRGHTAQLVMNAQ